MDREEYLLGRTVDKTLEQLNAEEKQKQSNALPQPKNHVEHECIPPSIRDYKLQVGEQVCNTLNQILIIKHYLRYGLFLIFLQIDLSAKLQEDPLVAIKKQEEERRRQFLQNPVQLKKLQDALNARQEMMKVKKKHKHKLKKEKKKAKDDNLDTILMHKFNELKDKLPDDDLRKILQGQFSDSDISSDSDEEERRKKSKSKKKKDKKEKRVSSKKHKNKRHASTDSSDSSEDEKKTKRSKEKHQTNTRDYRRYDKERVPNNLLDKRYREKETRRLNTSYKRDSSRSHKNVREYEKEHSSQNKRDRSSKEKNDKSNKSKRKQSSSSSEDTSDSDDKTNRNETAKRIKSDSDSEHETRKPKNWGLVKADGSKLSFTGKSPADNKTRKTDNVSEKTSDAKMVKKHLPKLTEEEKERRRKEMMENAAWRDVERTKNVKRYRDKDAKETANQDYDPDFVHKQLLKSAASSTVESRIKANINSIQRSKNDMNSHFSRR